MAVKNIYKTNKKEKSIYSTSGTANSSYTAAADTRNAPQSNVWNAEQSTPSQQSNTLQKSKREKSPSELGEEVIRSMLKEDAAEQQRQTAANSTVRYESGVAKTKAAGNQKTAQHGDAAVQFREPALYSSSSAAKPAVQSQKAITYGGTVTAQHGRPATAEPARQKSEKSPSELGNEVVRAMLEDEGLLKPSEPEGNEASAGRTFTAGVGRSDIIGQAVNAGEGSDSTQAIPEWLALMSTSDSDYPGLTAAANQLGFGIKEAAAQFTPDRINQLAPDWLDLMSMSNSDYPGLPMFASPVSPLLKNGTEPLRKLESEALPNEKRSGTLSREQDPIQQEQKEWWEEPGASEPIDPDDPAYQTKNAALTDDQRAAGLSVVKINGEYYVDVTIMINTRLQEVEQDFRNHFIDFQNSSIDNQGPMWANTAWFISQVKGNGPWDIKVKDSWLQQFGNILNLDDMSKTFAYNGQVVTPENLGNLTYGYLGRSMGWPAETLYLAGGIYNQFNLTAKKVVESEKTPTREGRMDPALFYWYNFLRPSVYSDGSYGDGENDYEFVKMGVELYEAVH